MKGNDMPDVFDCRWCKRPIRLILTPKNRKVPVAAGAIEPDQRPLPEGTYFDEGGRRYGHIFAPTDRPLYRNHNELCTGANRLRANR
jgi:hypothetical protein